jgi:hypothetical protein
MRVRVLLLLLFHMIHQGMVLLHVLEENVFKMNTEQDDNENNIV